MQANHKHLKRVFFIALLGFFQSNLFGSVVSSMPDTTQAHNFYANALTRYEAGKFQEASDLFDEAARLFTKKKRWERAVDCRLYVTKARSMNADEEGLLDYCIATLELSEKRLGPMHPLTGDCQNRLGELYYHGHKNDLARSCFDRALHIYSLDEEPDSLAMAKVYSNIGGVKMNLSQFDSARVFVKTALDIQLDLLDSLDMKLVPSYNTMGALNYYLGHMDQAIYNFEKTLQIRLNQFGTDHPEVASSFNNLGSAYEKKKEFQKAVDLHQKALDIRRTTLDSLHPNIALSLNNLANAWYGLGDYEKSNAYHFEALRLRKKMYGDNHRDIAMSYANIGHNLVLQDNPAEATYYFRKVVPIMIDLYGPDHLLTSDAYANLGLPFYYAGEYDSAFYYMFKALRIRENIQGGINLSIARSYNNIGALYKDNGDYELALSYYLKSAEVYEALLGKNCNPLSGSYNNMGEVYLETGDPETAYEFFRRSLDIDKANLGPDNPRLASRYLNLGAAAAAMGRHAESVEYNKQALHLHVGAYGEHNRLTGSIYRNMAMDYVEMDSLEIAQDYLHRAIEIHKGFYGEKHFALSSYFTQLGLLLLEKGDLETARANLYDALSVNYSGEIDPLQLQDADTEKIIDKNQCIETLVAITQFNEALLAKNTRKEILSRNLTIYQLIADITVELRETYRLERSKLQALKKWDYLYSEAFKTAAALFELTGEELYFNRAFRFAGLKKASALTDAILMSQAMENSGIPDTLIHLEKTLLASLESNKQSLFALENGPESEDKKDSITHVINSMTIRLNDLYLNFERTYPKYNSLRSRYPQYMPEEIGAWLDPKTLLLDFMVSDSTIYTMLLSNKGHWIEKVEVPADFASRVNQLLRAVKKYRIEDYISTSKEIYRTLLQPLEKHFGGMEKIISIPDAYLLLLPFDILIGHEGPEDNPDLASQDYFIRRFETVIHYSTDLWVRSMEMEQAANRAHASISGFIGFAPVFDEQPSKTETLLAESTLVETDTSYTSRAVVDRMSLKALPHSLREVNDLVAMFSEQGEPATAFIHADATERNFREKTTNYRFIHIATHGLINPEKPELSGLVFWKDTSIRTVPDPQLLIAQKENDGVLYTKEMYNLLLHADLVTLSACETGAGTLVKGEGLLSFVRGFTFAGVPNVLISYWKVNDQTTADFMSDFYGGVLAGDAYPTALRKAKLAAISKSSSAFPATWGTFVLIGH